MPNSAGTLVFNDKKEILWVDGPKGGGLPFGKVDTWEKIRDAAARETFEETGIQVKIQRLIWEVRIGDMDTFLYRAEMVGGELTPCAECTPVWVPVTQLLDPRNRFPEYTRWLFKILTDPDAEPPVDL